MSLLQIMLLFRESASIFWLNSTVKGKYYFPLALLYRYLFFHVSNKLIDPLYLYIFILISLYL